MLTSAEISLLAMGLCYLTSIFATYMFQFVKHIRNKSVDGINPHFMLIGNISSVCSFINSLIFYFSVIHECFEIDLILCLNKSLGLYQIGSQYLCYLILYLIYAILYRIPVHIMDSETALFLAPHQIKRKRGFIILYYFLAMLGNIVLLTITLILLSKNNWHGDQELINYARVFGIIATVAVVLQYLPQIRELYMKKNAKNLSVVTYILLAVGNFISFFYLTMQEASDVTTWISYLVCMLVQCTMIMQIIHYERRRKILERTHSLQYDDDSEIIEPY